MSSSIKLGINNINFRMERNIQSLEAAERAVNDLRAKLVATETGRRLEPSGNYRDTLRLKITLQRGYGSLVSKVYLLKDHADCAEAVNDLQRELLRLVATPDLTEGTKTKPSLELVHSVPKAESTEPHGFSAVWTALEWEISQIRREVEEIDNICGLHHQHLMRQLELCRHDAGVEAALSHMFKANDMIVRRSNRIKDSLRILCGWPEAEAA